MALYPSATLFPSPNLFPSGGGAEPPPDTEDPVVTLTAPANGATVTGSVPLEATATDNVGVSFVEFYVDGVFHPSADSTSPYTGLWVTSPAMAGSHTIHARAQDAAGNEGVSQTVTVTVPEPPPVISGDFWGVRG